ncbi:MAG: VapE family protein [Eubacteriales bacterium]|nr:VapE family protein [Eubacteriales bacterium]
MFAGTTNMRQFLPFDRTGTRRFLPIEVDASKAEKHILDDEKESREYIDQYIEQRYSI